MRLGGILFEGNVVRVSMNDVFRVFNYLEMFLSKIGTIRCKYCNIGSPVYQHWIKMTSTDGRWM